MSSSCSCRSLFLLVWLVHHDTRGQDEDDHSHSTFHARIYIFWLYIFLLCFIISFSFSLKRSYIPLCNSWNLTVKKYTSYIIECVSVNLPKKEIQQTIQLQQLWIFYILVACMVYTAAIFSFSPTHSNTHTRKSKQTENIIQDNDASGLLDCVGGEKWEFVRKKENEME